MNGPCHADTLPCMDRLSLTRSHAWEVNCTGSLMHRLSHAYYSSSIHARASDSCFHRSSHAWGVTCTGSLMQRISNA
eukprot:363883-Chlamydomonas_euryale.AAC.12